MAAQSFPETSDTCPVQLFLDQLLTKGEAEQQAPVTLDPDDPLEQTEPVLEAPFTEEEYQTLLDDI